MQLFSLHIFTTSSTFLFTRSEHFKLHLFIFYRLETRESLSGCLQDKTVQTGQVLEQTCCTTGSDPVNWEFKGKNNKDFARVYNGESLVDHFKNKFSVIAHSRCFTIKSTNTTVDQSGTYKCVDNAGFGPDKANAEVFVISKFTSLPSLFICIT